VTPVKIGDATIHHGDVRAVLAELPADSIDACVTDPPYHLTTGKKGGTGPASVNLNTPAGRARVTTGFMGQAWDGGDVAMRAETWVEGLRVLKPGAHLLAFGGTRTHHRLMCAIEDAGFEIRDCLGWLYGSGFPKSLNVGDGWGTALKPAWEPIVLARKPLDGTVLANIGAHGTGAMNIDGCRVLVGEQPKPCDAPGWDSINLKNAEAGYRPADYDQGGAVFEPSPLGRWPANIIHDGSDEVLDVFPQSAGQLADASSSSRKTQHVYGDMKRGNGREGEESAGRRYTEKGGSNFAALPGQRRGDTGSAARFFYCAKASKADRCEGNSHPTVKPHDLMRYLCRLVTPPGGTVLDCFNGSGSTGVAAMAEGFKYVGIELNADYIAMSVPRLEAATAQGRLFA